MTMLPVRSLFCNWRARSARGRSPNARLSLPYLEAKRPVGSARAATQVVDSVTALQTAVNAARPGDTVVLKNGTYATTAPITIAVAGTAGQPVVIAAETVGGAELGGTHGFDVVSPAAYIVIKGFIFTHAAGKACM